MRPRAYRDRVRSEVLTWIAVAAGGALGTGLRLAVDLLMPHAMSEVPWSTLVVNTLGSFALGLLVGAVWARVRPWVQAGLGPGLLGAFTTYSAIAVSVVAIWRGDLAVASPEQPAVAAPDAWTAVLVVAASVLLGLVAAWLGLALGARAARSGARS